MEKSACTNGLGTIGYSFSATRPILLRSAPPKWDAPLSSLTKPIGLSTDTADEHRKWIKDVNETQHTNLTFPIIADADLAIAKMYDMIHPGESETAAVRSVFIIDPDKKIRLTMTYPMSVGRNFDEILRVIDALQLSDSKRIATPADWQIGKEVIIPPLISNEEAKGLFPQGWTEHRPYLRTTAVS